MGTLLLVLIGIAAAFLIIAVLIQPGKGELSATMGGIGSQFGSMLGMRKAADMLQKITIGIAIFIFAGTLLINRFFLTASETARKPVTEGQEATAPAAMPMQQPTQPAEQQPAK
jgi:protein translocase SecG subunit